MILAVGVVAAALVNLLVNLLFVVVVSFWVVLGRRSSGKKKKTKRTWERFLFWVAAVAGGIAVALWGCR